MNFLYEDYKRYGKKSDMPLFQYHYRKYQDSSFFIIKLYHKILLTYFRRINLTDWPANVKIGPGLYIGHPYCITINSNAVLGSNINISKGVTIGQENRGKRKGVPTIGNNVWIGVNSTIVGAIHIGNDVLIAPNSLVNCDVPDHSIVIGNPCFIKHREHATEGYINFFP